MSTTEGAGNTIDGSGDHNRLHDLSFVMPGTIQKEQQNIDSDVNSFEKNIIVDKATKVSAEPSPIKTLSMSEIIQHIQEKFKNDASALLQSLASHPLQFSYDSNGILSIFGTKYPGNCTFHPF